MASEVGTLKKILSLSKSGSQVLPIDHLQKLYSLRHQASDPTPPGPEEEAIAPRFLFDISDVTIYAEEGQAANFEARLEPKHDLNLSVRWLHNGKEIIAGERYRMIHEFGYVSLNIFYTYPEDEGEYTCIATNELGETSTSAQIYCKSLPLLKFPVMSNVATEIPQEDLLMLVSDTAEKFGIDNALKEDDIFKSSNPRPPRFVGKVKDVARSAESTSARLETQLSPIGDPSMTVQWFHNDKPLKAKTHLIAIYEFGYIGLKFRRVYPDDFGRYTCRVQTSSGEASFSANVGSITDTPERPAGNEDDVPEWCNKVEKGKLNAKIAPEISKGIMDVTVKETEKVKFEIHYIGNPKPTVKWMLGSQQLSNSKHVQIRDREGKSTLLLINTQPDMAGVYTVSLESKLGFDSTTATLKIECLSQEERTLIHKQDSEGLDEMVRYEENKLIEKRKKKEEKEQRLREIKEKATAEGNI